jgi:formiminotetrahydrofolate cyclodeaminase
MDKKLKDYTVEELLRKFGAGNHKPGSGSASAFEGMLSAQLLITVIDLSNEPKRRARYAEHRGRLSDIRLVIEERIFPRLDELFQQDSEQFDRVIQLRDQRDAERDPAKKSALVEEVQKTLKKATNIPLEIAELCLELVGFAEEVFDHGFRSARGDAGVTLNGALSAVISCLSIIELNILSLPVDAWMDRMVEKKKHVRAQYNNVSLKGEEKLKVLESEAQEHLQAQRAMVKFRQGNLESTVSSDAQLEKLVRELQNLLWIHRETIWKTNAPEVPLSVLKPRIVLEKILGYAYYELADLGKHEVNGEWFETAGIIDKVNKTVGISTHFQPATQMFSLAHELGHAILHNKTVLHRDKSIDGPGGANRSPEERQADKFAAYFLLPETAVRHVFDGIFHLSAFEINQANTIALGVNNPSDLRDFCHDSRGLARVLAMVDRFAGSHFTPMSDVFSVSAETMAIRLEELGLVQF